MDRTRTLTVGAIVVVGLALLTAAAVPGIVADPGDEGPLRPGPVNVVEAPVSVGTVTGQQAELTLHTVLRHRGNPTENVTVEFRAIDTESGLLATEKAVDVGTLRGDTETEVDATLAVERQGGYRLEAIVFRNGSRVDTFSRTVRGVEALTPGYARANVSFVEDPVLEPISASVAGVENNRTTLDIGTWLTATGPNDADELTVTLIVRQAESNIVAARTTTTAGDLREGRSEMLTTSVTVPSDYNYYVDAVLTKDGVIVDTAAGVVNLDPKKTVQRNTTEQDVEFNVGDFDGSGDRRTEEPEGTARGRNRPTETATPGLGPVVAVVALVSLALLARRRE